MLSKRSLSVVALAAVIVAAAVAGMATWRHSSAKAQGRRLLAEGRDLLDGRHYDRAVACLTAALEKPLPRNLHSDAYTFRARARRESGAPAEAIIDLTRAIELEPNDPRSYVERALAHEAAGDESKAVADFSRAIDLRTRDSRAFARRGLLFLQRGEAKRAVADLTEADRIGGLEPDHFVALARAYDAINNLPFAIRTLDAALTNFPQHQEARQLRGDLYFKSGELDKASADYAQLRTERGAFLATRAAPPMHAPASAGMATDLLQKADAEQAAGRFESAIALYNQLLGMDLPLPHASIACRNRGNAYRAAGDLERALRDFEQAIRFDPTNAVAYLCRGVVYAARGDHEAAIKDHNEAIRFAPKLSDGYFNRALSFRELENVDAALRDVNEAIRLQSDYALAHVFRGSLFEQQGKAAQAHADYEKAYRLNPRLPDAVYALARTALKRGAHRDALKKFTEVLTLDLTPLRRAEVLNAIAWLRATCPERTVRDGALAVRDAQAACDLTEWSDYGNVDTFAAALAENGEFDRAAEFQWFALSMWPEEDEGRKRGEERLRLYQQRRAYREAPQRGKAKPASSPSAPDSLERAPKPPSRSRAAPGGIS